MRIITVFSLVTIALLGCQSNSSQKGSYAGLLAQIRAPEIFEFGGDTYEVKHSAVGQKWAIVDYYRRGEGPKSWKRRLALRLDADGLNSLQQVTSIERSTNAKTYGSSVIYESKNGHSVDFTLITSSRYELNVSRYWNRTTGTVSLRYTEITSSAELHKIERAELHNFFMTGRRKAGVALEALNMPDIEIQSSIGP